MATSVSRLHAQIAKLQQRADALKKAALQRVLREIQIHGLTSADLFGGGVDVGNGRAPRKTTAAGGAKTKVAKAPKFGDDQGNVWGGMGKRPQWLKDALASGAKLEDFLLAGKPAAKKPTRAAKATKQAPAKKTRKASAEKKQPAKKAAPAARKRAPAKSKQSEAGEA